MKIEKRQRVRVRTQTIFKMQNSYVRLVLTKNFLKPVPDQWITVKMEENPQRILNCYSVVTYRRQCPILHFENRLSSDANPLSFFNFHYNL